jgi:tRNA threonylcarbamoyladenosine biosynthesis protein TsaE
MLLAAAMAADLRPGNVVALCGDLGAGKTCFVRGLCKALGGDASLVNSPTFTIMQEYPVACGRLVHVDAYRLRGEDDLQTIGWDELLQDGNAVIAVEWPERIIGAIPDTATRVVLEHGGHDIRHIEIHAGGDSA